MRHDRPGHTWLIERYRRLGYDAAADRRALRRARRGRARQRLLRALAARAGAARRRARRRLRGARRGATETALLERCYDERTGLFYDLAGRAERQVRVSTWSSLAPLALGALPEDVRRRLVEEHLLDPRRYHAPCGIPSVAREEPSFKPGFALWRCWRGPSWVNTAWLLVPPMRELGLRAGGRADRRLARARGRPRRACASTTTRSPAAGLAARGFGMSALLIRSSRKLRDRSRATRPRRAR